MIRVSRRALAGVAIAAALAMGACAPTAKLVEGRYETAGYTVMLGRPWSDVTALPPREADGVHFLTIDGPLLNRLYLAAELADGQALIRLPDKDAPRPTYRDDMSETEQVEFVIDSVAAMGYLAPEAAALRPQEFDGALGTRFEINSRTPEGLSISGTALTARVNDRLQVLIFLAPSEHYYDALLPEVEAVFASAATGG